MATNPSVQPALSTVHTVATYRESGTLSLKESMIMTSADEASSTSPARARRSRRPAGAAPRRGRGAQPGGEDLVASLSEMVDRLIAENRDLKRAIARAEQGAGAGLGQATRVLSGSQRRVSQALGAGVPAARGRGRAAAAEAAAPRPRRKVTDPEVLERRRAALAKARAARAAKRAAARE